MGAGFQWQLLITFCRRGVKPTRIAVGIEVDASATPIINLTLLNAGDG
jgi:hypothetical protein